MLSCDETGLEIAGLVDNDTNDPPPDTAASFTATRRRR